MRTAIFGGSFDPIHRGHIAPVLETKQRLELDRVIYLPTAVPPHKPEVSFAPAHARFAMVELALLDQPDLEVSPLELTPGRPAYTADSLKYFQQTFPTDELFLIIGGDSLAELHTWDRWQGIPELAQLAVLTRPDWTWQEVCNNVPAELQQLAASDRVHFIHNRPVAVSATALRRQIASGEAPAPREMSGLVLQYIRKYSLYQ